MTTQAPRHPVVLYDGECGFCKRHVSHGGRSATRRSNISRFRNTPRDSRRLQLNSSAERCIWLSRMEPSRGAQAVFRIAALSGKRPWLSLCYEYLPGFAGVTEFGYRFIASHRNLVDRVDRMLFGSSPNPTSIA